MPKYAAFTNYSDWDSDMIGFIGFADVDTTGKTESQFTEEIIKTIHSDVFVDRQAKIEEVKIIPLNERDAVYDENEVSCFVNPEFDVFGVVDMGDNIDMLIGLIEVR